MYFDYSQVTVPAFSTPFQPNKLSKNIESAKNFGAEFVLAQIGIPFDGGKFLNKSSQYLCLMEIPDSICSMIWN